MIYMFIAQATTQTDYPTWLIITLAILSSGALTAGLNWLFNRRKEKSDIFLTDAEIEKIEADASDIIQRAAGELILQIQGQYERTEAQNKILLEQNDRLIKQGELQAKQIAELKKDIDELHKGIDLLTAQLRDNGINPAYPPMPPMQ